MDFIFNNLEIFIFAAIVISQILAAIAKDKKKRQQQQQQQPQQDRSQETASAGASTPAPASAPSQSQTYDSHENADYFDDDENVDGEIEEDDDVYDKDIEENRKILESLGIVILDQEKPQPQTSAQQRTQASSQHQTQTQTHHRTTYSPPPPKPALAKSAAAEKIDCEWERAIIEKEIRNATRAAERAADTVQTSKIYDRNQTVNENELAKQARDGFVWMEILREPVSMR